MNRAALVFVALPLALAGCKKADNAQAAASAAPIATAAPTAAPTPAPTADPTAMAAAAAAAAAPAAAGGGDLATPEDFEQQALDEINPQNLEKELDTLEEQIGK